MFRKLAFIDLVIFLWLTFLTVYLFYSPFKLYVDTFLVVTPAEATPNHVHIGGKEQPPCPHTSEEEEVICTCNSTQTELAHHAGN